MGAVVTLLGSTLAFITGKGVASAALQAQINASMKLLMRQLETEKADCERELKSLRVEVRTMQQIISSLEDILRRTGIDIPRREPAEVVFVLDSSLENKNG